LTAILENPLYQPNQIIIHNNTLQNPKTQFFSINALFEPQFLNHFTTNPIQSFKTRSIQHLLNSVMDIFKIYSFSDTQINQIARQAPNIVNCDPNKRILPKFVKAIPGKNGCLKNQGGWCSIWKPLNVELVRPNSL
jgi:hypothetical protein